jgi:hypothetical protein
MARAIADMQLSPVQMNRRKGFKACTAQNVE